MCPNRGATAPYALADAPKKTPTISDVGRNFRVLNSKGDAAAATIGRKVRSSIA